MEVSVRPGKRKFIVACLKVLRGGKIRTDSFWNKTLIGGGKPIQCPRKKSSSNYLE
jgi:hypothetical protein